MASSPFFYALFFSSFALFYFPYMVTAQQPSTPVNYGAVKLKTCQSFLIYQTTPPYNTVSSIASLFSANASQISTLNNNIAEDKTLATNTKVIIPVTLSSCGNKKRKWEYFWKGVAVGASVVTVLGIILLCILREFDPIMSSQSFKKSMEIQKVKVIDDISNMASLKVHSFKDLQVATQNFSSDHAIKMNLHGDGTTMEKM